MPLCKSIDWLYGFYSISLVLQTYTNINSSIFVLFSHGLQAGWRLWLPWPFQLNFQVNKNSENFQQNDGEDDGAGSKRSLRCGSCHWSLCAKASNLCCTVAEGCVDSQHRATSYMYGMAFQDQRCYKLGELLRWDLIRWWYTLKKSIRSRTVD